MYLMKHLQFLFVIIKKNNIYVSLHKEKKGPMAVWDCQFIPNCHQLLFILTNKLPIIGICPSPSVMP